jgi:hypothetical protein
VPNLCGFYPGICLTTEEKARKTLSQFSLSSSCSEKFFKHNVLVKIKIHIFLLNSCFSENRAIYERVQKKYGTVEQATYYNIRRMGFACWIIKATRARARAHPHTLRICNTYYFSKAKMVTRTRLIIILCV